MKNKRIIAQVVILALLTGMICILPASSKTIVYDNNTVTEYETTPIGNGFSSGGFLYASPALNLIIPEYALDFICEYSEEKAELLKQALENIDYDNYDIIMGRDFIIKRIYLENGFYIDHGTIHQNDSNKRMKEIMSYLLGIVTVQDWYRLALVDEGLIAEVNMNATFMMNYAERGPRKTGHPDGIQYLENLVDVSTVYVRHTCNSEYSAPGWDITFSNTDVFALGEHTLMSMAQSNPVVSIPNIGDFRLALKVICTIESETILSQQLKSEDEIINANEIMYEKYRKKIEPVEVTESEAAESEGVESEAAESETPE